MCLHLFDSVYVMYTYLTSPPDRIFLHDLQCISCLFAH